MLGECLSGLRRASLCGFDTLQTETFTMHDRPARDDFASARLPSPAPGPNVSASLARRLRRIDTYRARGDWGAASELALACLDTPECRARPALSANLCHNLAGILREAREFELARGYQQLSSKFARHEAPTKQPPTGSAPTDSYQLSGEATDRLVAGDLDAAEIRLAISLELERKRGDLAGEAADWGNLAIVALLRNDSRSALFRLLRAWRLHRQLHDSRGCGVDLLHFAELALLLRKPRSARRFLERAAFQFSLANAPGLTVRALDRRDDCRIPLAQVRIVDAVN